jgi:integrase
MKRHKLTDAMIQRLKAPDGKQKEFFDAVYPALAVRVTPNGVKSFTYFGRVHGKLKRATLGRYPAMTLAEARRKAGETADAMRQGIDPAAAKRAQRAAVRDNFEAVLAEWLKRDQADNRSHAEVKRLIERETLPTWQGRPMSSITRRDVLDCIDAVVDRGSPIMARRFHAHLHRLFRWSVGRGLITVNPMEGMEKPGSEIKRDRVLSDAELAAVWRAAEKIDWPFGPVFQLLILTGARRQEIGDLRWQEIVGDKIELSGSRTKVGEAHTIPLSTLALDLIATLPRIGNSPYVFTTTGKTPISGWTRSKESLDKAAVEFNDGRALSDWRVHDLRRTVATGLQRLGVGLQVTEAVLGHVGGSRAGIVGVYQRHEYAEEKKAALEAWCRFVQDVLTRVPAKAMPMRRATPPLVAQP